MSAAYFSAMGMNPHERSPFNQIQCEKLDYRSTVTVIVWPEAGGKPGHVALQTYDGAGPDELPIKDEWRQRNVLNEVCKANGFFISFYPAVTPKTPCGVEACHWKDHPLHSNGEKCHYHTAQTDIQGMPQENLKIYHLIVGPANIEKINRAFKQHLKSPTSWRLLGSSFLRLPYERNCSGLVLSLLKRGGINNPYQSRVNMVLRSSVFAASLGFLTVGMAYATYRRYPTFLTVDAVVQDVKNSADLSQKTYRSAIALSRLVDRDLSPDEQTIIKSTDYLMTEASQIFLRAVPQVCQTVNEGKTLLKVAGGVTVAASALVIGGGFCLTQLLREAVTPSDVERVVERAPQRKDALTLVPSSCCEGQFMPAVKQSPSPSLLTPLAIASAFLCTTAFVAYKGLRGSK